MAGNTYEIQNAVVRITATTEDVEAGVKKARSILSKGLSAINTFISNPAVGLSLGNQFTTFIQGYLKEAQDIKRFADLNNENVRRMSAWATEAENNGIQLSTFGDVLTDLSDKITDFRNNGSGPIKELIDRGLIKDDAIRGATKTLDFLEQLNIALRRVDRQERVGILKRLGINDPNMLMMLSKNGEFLRATINKIQREKKAFYSEDDTKNAKEFSAALRDIAASFKHNIMPAISLAIRMLSLLATHLRVLYPLMAMLAWQAAARFTPAFVNLVKSLNITPKKLGAYSALLLLGALLDEFVQWARGADSKFGGIFEAIFGSRQRAQEIIDTFSEWRFQILLLIIAISALKTALVMVGAIKKAVDLFSSFIGIVKAAAIAVKAFSVSTLIAMAPYIAAAAAFSAALYLIYIYWDDICDAVSKAVKLIGDAIDAAEAWFEEFKKNPIDAIVNLLDSWWTAIGDWFKEKAGSFNLADLFTFLNPGTYAISKIREFLGSSDDGMALAAAGGGSVNNNVEATQTIVQNFNGDTSKQTIEAATAGATAGGLTAAVNSGNYG